MKNTFPNNPDERLNDYFFKLYRKTKNKNYRCYEFLRRSLSGITYLTCHNIDTHDHIVIRIWDKGYPENEYDILGHCQEACDLCRPIIDQWIQDVKDYCFSNNNLRLWTSISHAIK